MLQALEADAAWQDNDLIFCQPDGRPWNPDYVTRRFKRLAAQAGVPVLTLHEGGRHTADSLMRDAGVDQEIRMREVGHADRASTTDTPTTWPRRTWPPPNRSPSWSGGRLPGHELH